MRITRNQSSRSVFIYSADDEVVATQVEHLSSNQRLMPFMAKNSVASGAGDACLIGEEFTARVAKRSLTIDTSKLKIQGLHNCYNAMAASLAALAAGVECSSIEQSLYSFSPVEHRLEPAGERDGVLWINDSKATNVDSVWYALQSMKRPTVWIAGGTDKGNDYTPLKEFARQKVKALVCMGLDNAKLEREFAGVVPIVESYSSPNEALTAARRLAQSGDAVLLSPACASFDLFKNYEQRGRLFKQWVEENVLR
jgi:UDP-N-acetylmuramoylalanine--D-glutamate ligase